MAIKIQLRRDTVANWYAANPVLAQGEMGLETDSLNMKLGDGSTTWRNLPYGFYALGSIDGGIAPNTSGATYDGGSSDTNVAPSSPDGAAGGVSYRLSTAIKPSATNDVTRDDTNAIETYLNTVSTTVKAINANTIAMVFVDAGYYRVANCTIPSNIVLMCQGTRFSYVASNLNPPTGVGNWLFRMTGSFTRIVNATFLGSSTQAGVGGVWSAPAGATGIGVPRAYQQRLIDCTWNLFAGRGWLDQGVGDGARDNLVLNTLLGYTTGKWFQAAFERVGTDGWCVDNEVTISNNTYYPRCPAVLDAGTTTTTTSSVTFPMTNGTIPVASINSSIATTGGIVSVGGHTVTYDGASTGQLTNCNCTDTATVASGSVVSVMMGLAASTLMGGATNSSHNNVYEISDVGVVVGRSMHATVTATTTLSTTPQVLPVDCALYFRPLAPFGANGLTITGSTLSFPAFSWTSISEATLTASTTFTSSTSTVAVSSTAGWPASGSFHCKGWTVTYSSIADSTHLAGCTIGGAGNPTFPSGTYIRANALNGAQVASGTLVFNSGDPILNAQVGSGTQSTHDRADFPLTHGWYFAGGTGDLTKPQTWGGSVAGDGCYDGFHNPTGSQSAMNVERPTVNSSYVAPTARTGVTPRYRIGILDTNGGTSSFCEYEKPKLINVVSQIVLSSFSAAKVELMPGRGGALSNSTTPTVQGVTQAYFANVAAVTVTNFANGFSGQRILIFQDKWTTIQNNSTIQTKSGADITPPAAGLVPLQFVMEYGATGPLVWYQL